MGDNVNKRKGSGERRYRLTVSEGQLRMIADCVEDMSRLMAGQTDMWNTLSRLDKYYEIRERLEELKPLVTPGLERNASYGWDGGGCPERRQAEYIARGYALYREILHRMRVLRRGKDSGKGEYCVYDSPTLRCELGGELPVVELVEGGEGVDDKREDAGEGRRAKKGKEKEERGI